MRKEYAIVFLFFSKPALSFPGIRGARANVNEVSHPDYRAELSVPSPEAWPWIPWLRRETVRVFEAAVKAVTVLKHGFRKEEHPASVAESQVVFNLELAQCLPAAHADHPDYIVPAVRVVSLVALLICSAVIGVCAIGDADGSIYLIHFVCHLEQPPLFYYSGVKQWSFHSIVKAKGTFSGPLDNSLGSDADPVRRKDLR